jgi:hypothetical protein
MLLLLLYDMIVQAVRAPEYGGMGGEYGNMNIGYVSRRISRSCYWHGKHFIVSSYALDVACQ